jgi:uncharacterized protein (TIGR03437 family)
MCSENHDSAAKGVRSTGLLILGILFLSPVLRADQTLFSGTFKANGVRGSGICPTPGPFTVSANINGAVQPSLASLAGNGGTASGFFSFANFTSTGCEAGRNEPSSGTVSATVAAGGATTIMLTIPDPTDPTGIGCVITVKGTTSSQTGDAILCFDQLVSGTAPVVLAAQVAAPAGTLRVAPTALQFTGVAGGGATPSQTLGVFNDTSFQNNLSGQWTGTATDQKGAKPLTGVFVQIGSVLSGGLTTSTPNGTQAVVIQGTVVGTAFTFTLPDLGNGEYATGQATFTANTISGTYIDYKPGSPSNPGTLTLTRQGTGFGPVSTLNWTATSSTVTGSGWLNVQPLSGASTSGTGASLTVSAQTAALQAGQYSGQILVSSPDAANSPVAVTLLLTVVAANSGVHAQTRPTGLIFFSNGTAPPAQSVQVSTAASSTQQLTVKASTTNGGSWLGTDKTSATLSNASPVNLSVTAGTTGLTPGVYRGQLALTFSDGSPSQAVNVVLVISASGTAPATIVPALSGTPAASCVPATLLAVDRTIGSNFSSVVAWPTTIEAIVADDCGNLSSSATVVASFSDSDPPLAMTPLGGGIYQATWRPVNSSNSPVTVTITATQQPLQQAVVTLGGSVGDNPNVPAIFAGGMVGAAGYDATALPPGGIISIFGKNLAQSGGASSLPLPINLGSLTLTAAGQNLPLFYTSNGQVNAQLPAELNPGTRVAVVAKAVIGGNTILSVPEIVTVGPTAPGIFSANQSGKGQGVILDGSNSLLDGKQASATAGQVVVIYCTGLGATSPAVPSGQAAPGNPTAQVVTLPLVSIGGLVAPVQFAGMTPGLVGLYQLNVTVPAGVTGAAVPVVITHQGFLSNSVTMAVR